MLVKGVPYIFLTEYFVVSYNLHTWEWSSGVDNLTLMSITGIFFWFKSEFDLLILKGEQLLANNAAVIHNSNSHSFPGDSGRCAKCNNCAAYATLYQQLCYSESNPDPYVEPNGLGKCGALGKYTDCESNTKLQEGTQRDFRITLKSKIALSLQWRLYIYFEFDDVSLLRWGQLL